MKRKTRTEIQEGTTGDRPTAVGARARLETLELAKRIVEAAADKQASNVVLLDSREVCSFADYLVICSAESDRQMEAIRGDIVDVLKEESVALHHLEGDASSGWMLLDLGDIVIHIFAPFEREYYQLEELWNKAPVVVKIL